MNKHYKLRHSKCGREKFGSGHRQNDEKKKPRVKHEPRRPMAARLKKKKKPRVKHEPRRPMAARLTRRSFRSYNRAIKIQLFS